MPLMRSSPTWPAGSSLPPAPKIPTSYPSPGRPTEGQRRSPTGGSVSAQPIDSVDPYVLRSRTPKRRSKASFSAALSPMKNRASRTRFAESSGSAGCSSSVRTIIEMIWTTVASFSRTCSQNRWAE